MNREEKSKRQDVKTDRLDRGAGGITRRVALIVFLVALAARAGWGTHRLIRAPDASALEFPDEQQYWSSAVGLWNGQGLRDELGFRATRMPLYPSVLAPFTAYPHGVITAKAVHWLIGAAAAAFTAALATTLFDRRVGVLAGALVALDPFLVFSSSLLLTETPYLCVAIALWWLLAAAIRSDRVPLRRWLLIGVLGASCVYLRESSLGLYLAGLAFVVCCRRFEPRSTGGVAAAAVFMVASLVPWAVRNRQITGEWRWLTTRAGISLYDGVGPTATGSSDLGDIKQMPAVRSLTETEWNRYFLDESVRAIRGDPVRVVRLAGVKLARTWNPMPNVDAYQSRFVRFVSAAWTMPTFALALLGTILLPIGHGYAGARWAMFLLLPAFYLSLVHSLFVGSVRYRLGAIPMLEVLAAFACITLFDSLRRRGKTLLRPPSLKGDVSEAVRGE